MNETEIIFRNDKVLKLNKKGIESELMKKTLAVSSSYFLNLNLSQINEEKKMCLVLYIP